MTKKERLELLQEAMHKHLSNKQLRYGQCIYEVALEMFYDEAIQIRGTQNDCFYLDENIEKFIEQLYKLTEQ